LSVHRSRLRLLGSHYVELAAGFAVFAGFADFIMDELLPVLQ
jgi:hypothetical protein